MPVRKGHGSWICLACRKNTKGKPKCCFQLSNATVIQKISIIFSEMHIKRTKSIWQELQQGKICLNISKKTPFFKSGSLLEQDAQRGCQTCILGDIQNLTRQDSEQPALTWKLSLLRARGWIRRALWVFSNINYFTISDLQRVYSIQLHSFYCRSKKLTYFTEEKQWFR